MSALDVEDVLDNAKATEGFLGGAARAAWAGATGAALAAV